MPLTIAAGREVFLSSGNLVAALGLFLFATQVLGAQQPREKAPIKYVIEHLELVGNRRVRSATLIARISSRPGTPYSVKAMRRGVQALWDTQLFEDVHSEVEDNPHLPNGKS